MNRKNKTRGLSSESEQVIKLQVALDENRRQLETFFETQSIILNGYAEHYRKVPRDMSFTHGYWDAAYKTQHSRVCELAALLGIATKVYFHSEKQKWIAV
jgi:uncharacterized membrane-anchored protein YhcB (DUF1043 family)